MSRKVPEGWTANTLGATCSVKARIGWRGLAASEYTPSGPLLIAGKHIKNGQIDWDACDHLNDERFEESPEIQLQCGDVIFSKDGSIGNPALIRTLPDRASINGTMMLLRPNSELLHPGFLYQFICGQEFLRLVEEKISGSSIPHIFQRDIVHLSFSLPPISEQEAIVEVLESVDRYIDLTAQAMNCTQTTKNAALIDTLSGHWPETTLESLLRSGNSAMRSGPFGSALLKSELQPTGIPFLGIDNVHAERFVRSYKRFISEEKYRELARYTVFPGDVMVTIMGTVGRCCVVPADIGTAISSKHVWTITLDQERYSPHLLAWQINHAPWVLEQLSGSSQGGVMAAVNSEILRNLRLPMPPLSRLREIETLLGSFNTTISSLEGELIQAEQVKMALSNELMMGHIRMPVTDRIGASTTTRVVQPAFKRAVLAAEVVHQLHKDTKFGSVKHEKIVHLCEHHAGLHHDIDRHAYKKAAGPYDPKARRSVEANFKSHKWFDVRKAQGGRTEYVPLEKCGGHKQYFDRYFADQREIIQTIIDLLRPLDSQRCEIITTLYAVWNDCLIDGTKPTDRQIVDGARNNWHASKQAIPEDRWLKALEWMRQKNLVPSGTGEKTRVATV